MPLTAEGTGRTFRQNVTLAVLLALVAGAVNAVGFFVLGTHTSHMTGQVAAVGEAMARGHMDVALTAAKFVAAFVLGAAAAAALLDLTTLRTRGRYTPVLALEGIALIAGALWAAAHHGVHSVGLGLALSFAMGLQNAMVTRISRAVVRTTHLTGVLTDFGMEVTRVTKWLFAQRLEPGVRHFLQSMRVEFERAWLHLALIVSFLVGATVGPLLLFYTDEAALGLPCMILVGLIVHDWQKPRPGDRPSTSPPAATP